LPKRDRLASLAGSLDTTTQRMPGSRLTKNYDYASVKSFLRVSQVVSIANAQAYEEEKRRAEALEEMSLRSQFDALSPAF
jgi:hypothetical protein